MGVTTGSQVITTPMTFIATASTASMLGAEVVFADVCEDTALIDPNLVADLVTEQTKVIAAVDYAGMPADYQRLQQIADSVGAHTLADAAHSIGGSSNGVPVGSLAEVTALSFFPTKNMTTGEGGAVLVRDDAELGRRASEFRNIGLVRDPARFQVPDQGAWHQEVHEFGLNYRLSDVACALGMSQLSKLEAFKQRREEITKMYNEGLAGIAGLKTPVQTPGVNPAWHLYPLQVLEGRRREVYDRMRAGGIGVQVNYLPVYWHPVYANAGYQKGLCPNAEKFYEQELSLPLYPSLTDDEVNWVIETLHQIVQ